VAAAAIEGVTIASEAATGATIAFRTALISTGIGAIIIGLIYGVTKLIGAISDWINADEHAAEAQKALSESTSQLLGTYKELEEVYSHYSEEVQKDFERRAQLAQDAGKNEFIQLENERRIAAYRLIVAKNDIDQKHIDQKTVDGLH